MGLAICHPQVLHGTTWWTACSLHDHRKICQVFLISQTFPKIAVQLLVVKVLRNCNTLTGQNVIFVLDKTRAEDITKVNVTKMKNDIEFCDTKYEDKWRLSLVKEIVNIKNNILTLNQNEDNLTTEDFLKYCTVHLR